jgi:hypothetical protein
VQSQILKKIQKP